LAHEYFSNFWHFPFLGDSLKSPRSFHSALRGIRDSGTTSPVYCILDQGLRENTLYEKKKIRRCRLPMATSVPHKPVVGSIKCLVDGHLNIYMGLHLLLHEFFGTNPVARISELMHGSGEVTYRLRKMTSLRPRTA
jgi:hypothetical protein